MYIVIKLGYLLKSTKIQIQLLISDRGSNHQQSNWNCSPVKKTKGLYRDENNFIKLKKEFMLTKAWVPSSNTWSFEQKLQDPHMTPPKQVFSNPTKLLLAKMQNKEHPLPPQEQLLFSTSTFRVWGKQKKLMEILGLKKYRTNIYVFFMKKPKMRPSKPMMITNLNERPPWLLLLSRLRSSYTL